MGWFCPLDLGQERQSIDQVQSHECVGRSACARYVSKFETIVSEKRKLQNDILYVGKLIF